MSEQLPVEIAIREMLLADSGLFAKIGARIYPVITPQKPTFPLMLFRLSSGECEGHIAGASDEQIRTIELNLYSASYDEIKYIARRTIAVLHGYSGTVIKGSESVTIKMIKHDSESDSDPVQIPGGDQYIFEVSQTFRAWF